MARTASVMADQSHVNMGVEEQVGLDDVVPDVPGKPYVYYSTEAKQDMRTGNIF